MTSFRDEAEKILDAYHGFEPTIWKDGNRLWRSLSKISRDNAVKRLTALHEREVERIIGDIGKNINSQDYWRYDGELRGKIILSDIQRRRANGEGE